MPIPSTMSRNAAAFAAFLLCFFLPDISDAQQSMAQFKPFPLHEGDGFHAPAAPGAKNMLSSGTVHIVAVMVDFEPEENEFTSGDGTFELDYLMRNEVTIDPLPHDQNYFEAHLEFARNYFAAASGGQLDIDYRVLPQVYTLPEPMQAYSPTGPDDSQNFRLANLARDTWQQVAAETDATTLGELEQLPQERTMFVLFHAGAGRDLELTGTTLNNTPQDIPSVFLGSESLERLTEEPDFTGFPLTPNLRVTNTAVLPQTQSRAGEDVTGEEFVLELSINGILTANIGSFIGLPDLFNTDNGRSGIGQFGLMDGAGIFSYYGLFPPLPSAWERLYMGWDSVFDISLDDESAIQLPAVSSGQQPALARHRISADEYFLVENRHRDPEDSGVVLSFRLPDGSTETRQFDNEEDRFNPLDQTDYDEIMPAGVLINVSNFDWSLPGGLDIGEDGEAGTDQDRLLNGGMLIWHIDEAVIRSRIDDNSINNDIDRRGIALQEADGAQDLGRPAQGISNFSTGGPFDFWWSGNDFTVITASGGRIVLYENRFADDTFPNNRSNTGSPSYFEFYDFSDNLATASFRARRASTDAVSLWHEAQLSQEFSQPASRSIAWPHAPDVLRYPDSIGDEDAIILLPGNENVLAFDTRDRSIAEAAPASEIPFFSDDGLAIAYQQGDDIAVELYDLSDDTSAGLSFTPRWQQLIEDKALAGGLLSSSFRGEQTLDIDGSGVSFARDSGVFTPRPAGYQESGAIGGQQAFIEDDELIFPSSARRPLPDAAPGARRYAALIQLNSSTGPQPLLLEESRLSLMAPDAADDVILGHDATTWPALHDLNEDGQLDFIFVNTAENRLEGRNSNAALLHGFPLDAPRGQEFTGTPLLADLTGDGRQELIVPAADSLSYLIHAYDSRQRPLDGFPLYAGSLGQASDHMPVQPFIHGNKLYAISPAGDFKVWEFENMDETSDEAIAWGRVYGNAPGNKVLGIPAAGSSPAFPNQLLNDTETYNWPNPAQDETFIRYQTDGSAEITISVADMGGRHVYERQLRSSGGAAEEVRVSTAGWGSGVYYARVRARQDGREETTLIKIAIVR